MPTDNLELIGRPNIKWMFNGQREITRYYTVHGSAGDTDANIQSNVFVAFGTADTEEVFENALLVAQQLQRTDGNMAVDATLVRVFQEFSADDKVEVGENILTVLEDGRTSLTIKYVALSSVAESKVATVGTVLGSRALQTATVQHNGVGAVITETYISSGVLSTGTEYSNGGALEIQTSVFYNTTPPYTTPSGFTLIGLSTQSPNGVPQVTARFAKGTGEVSRDINDALDGHITYTTVRSLGAARVAAPGEFEFGSQKQDGYVLWTSRGITVVSASLPDETDVMLNGAVTITTKRKIDAAPTGTGVSLGVSVAPADGYTLYTDRFVVATNASSVQVTTSEGPIAGTKLITTVSVGTAVTPTGVLIESSDITENGYTRYIRKAISAISGTITGTKTTYADTVEVMTPGTVALTTVAIAAGGLTGTDAVIAHTPPRTKTVAATVTVSVETTPPTTAALAYNLENISCSVTNTRASYAYVGSDVYENLSGSSRLAMPKYRASIGASIASFPGCYITTATSVSGSFTYTAGSEAGGLGTSAIVITALTATVVNTLTGTGATSGSGYATTGVLQRKIRPLLTALDGTVYWEVVTWTV